MNYARYLIIICSGKSKYYRCCLYSLFWLLYVKKKKPAEDFKYIDFGVPRRVTSSVEASPSHVQYAYLMHEQKRVKVPSRWPGSFFGEQTSIS